MMTKGVRDKFECKMGNKQCGFRRESVYIYRVISVCQLCRKNGANGDGNFGYLWTWKGLFI